MKYSLTSLFFHLSSALWLIVAGVNLARLTPNGDYHASWWKFSAGIIFYIFFLILAQNGKSVGDRHG